MEDVQVTESLHGVDPEHRAPVAGGDVVAVAIVLVWSARTFSWSAPIAPMATTSDQCAR